MKARSKAGYRHFSSLLRPTRGRVRFVLLAVVLFTALATNTSLEGRVVSIPDADTLVVYSGNGQTQRVRLYGVDCPELGQAFGPEAARVVEDLTRFKQLSLTVMYTDRYKRAVAVVHLPDGQNLNEVLLRRGLAWHYDSFCQAPFCKNWKALEKEARAKKRGLWAQGKPQAPWKWRKAHPR